MTNFNIKLKSNKHWYCSYIEITDDLNEIDRYVNYIFDLIDECDSFYFSYRFIDSEYYNSNLKYTFYNELKVGNQIMKCESPNTDAINCIYDISSEESKNFFKENIRFNISNENDGEPMVLETDCKNIANDTAFYAYNSMRDEMNFVKNKELLYTFFNYDGLIWDHKNFQKEKDLEFIIPYDPNDKVREKYYNQYVHPEKDKARKKVIIKIINNPYCITHVNEKWKNDKELALLCVKLDYETVKDLNEKFRNDNEIIFEVVKKNGKLLKASGEVPRNNKEIVLTAVRDAGYTLKYASDELRNDSEVVLEAVKQNGYALEYASEDLRKDKEFIKEVISNGSFICGNKIANYIDEELKKDQEITELLKNKKTYRLN